MLANQPVPPYPEVDIPLYQPLPGREDQEVVFPIDVEAKAMPYIQVLGEEFVYAGIVYSMKMGRDLVELSNQLGNRADAAGAVFLQMVSVYKGLQGRMAFVQRQIEAYAEDRFDEIGLGNQLENQARQVVSLVLNKELEIIRGGLEAPVGNCYKQLVALEDRLVGGGNAHL